MYFQNLQIHILFLLTYLLANKCFMLMFINYFSCFCLNCYDWKQLVNSILTFLIYFVWIMQAWKHSCTETTEEMIHTSEGHCFIIVYRHVRCLCIHLHGWIKKQISQYTYTNEVVIFTHSQGRIYGRGMNIHFCILETKRV